MNKHKYNIVLIGMPGCGKTTIGRKLSEKLNRNFIDCDEVIENKFSCGIKGLFKKGEKYFRDEEEETIKEISSLKNFIISTGGGVVLREININNLKKHGKVIFIDRSIFDIINDVDIKTRPLLKDGTEKLYELYENRYNLYKKYCDIHVINDSSIDNIVDKIISNET